MKEKEMWIIGTGTFQKGWLIIFSCIWDNQGQKAMSQDVNYSSWRWGRCLFSVCCTVGLGSPSHTESLVFLPLTLSHDFDSLLAGPFPKILLLIIQSCCSHTKATTRNRHCQAMTQPSSSFEGVMTLFKMLLLGLLCRLPEKSHCISFTQPCCHFQSGWFFQVSVNPRFTWLRRGKKLDNEL